MKVQIKKLHPDAVIPRYATDGASGFDLTALHSIGLNPGETRLIETGLAIQVPRGFELQIRPRSGVSLKTPLRVANAPGTVDSDFTGQICVIITNTDPDRDCRYNTIYIDKGDRVAQGVICPIQRITFIEVDSLEETQRGTSGFGSSGK